jgi:putative transcriptional regulator
MAPAPDEHHIAVRLGDVMTQRGISLTDLADKVGITNVNLSRLKTGKVTAVKLATLSALCDVLECQPGDILVYTPPTPTDADT